MLEELKAYKDVQPTTWGEQTNRHMLRLVQQMVQCTEEDHVCTSTEAAKLLESGRTYNPIIVRNQQPILRIDEFFRSLLNLQ